MTKDDAQSSVVHIERAAEVRLDVQAVELRMSAAFASVSRAMRGGLRLPDERWRPAPTPT
ncbi:MAG: hypothetical protein ACRDZW_01580 [Acidimicrobiales bacterium]